MVKKTWVFGFGNDHHIVELNYNRFTLGTRLEVDGDLVDEWSWCLRSKEIPFEVEGQDVLLKFEVNHLSRNKQKLYVNGLVM